MKVATNCYRNTRTVNVIKRMCNYICAVVVKRQSGIYLAARKGETGCTKCPTRKTDCQRPVPTFKFN